LIRRFSIIILVWIFWWTGNAHTQLYPFKRYTVDDGLPQSVVYTVFQDSRGYIWTGTQGGLSRFDGIEFTTFTVSDGLPSERVLFITEDGNGGLWIGTQNGVTRFDGKQLTGYSDSLGSVFSVFPDQTGMVFIGTSEGLAFSHTGDPGTFTFIDGIVTPVYTIFHRSYQSLLIGTADGLLSLNYDNPNALSVRPLHVTDPVMCIARDNDGKIWVGTDGGGLAVIQNDSVKWYTADDGLGNNKIYSILVDTADVVWIGTYGRGVNKISQNHVSETYTYSNGLPSNVIRSILRDREGNIWFATYGGLAMLRRTGLTYFDTSQGLANSIVMAILRDKAGTLWIGTYGGGISKMRNGSIAQFKIEHGLSHNAVRSLLEDSKGNIWIGTHGGATKVHGQSIRHYTTRDGLPGDVILAMLEDSRGRIWFGTFGAGVGIMSEGKFSTLTTSEGLAHNTVRSILEDENGTIWIGTDEGLNRYDEGFMRKYTTEEGLTHNTIRALAFDTDGSLWIGTDGGGVNILTNDTVRALTVEDGLANNVCYIIIADNDNNFWIGTNKGLNRVARNSETGNVYDIDHVHMRDGLPSNEFNTGAGYLDHDNTLWFGTVGGLVRLGRNFEARNPVPPKLILTKVRVFETPREIDTMLVLDYNENYLKFEYSGLHYSSPEDVEYKYRLIGLDSDWSISTGRSVQYTSLKPGRYSFELTARSRGSDWNPEPMRMNIRIIPPYWATWWFRVGMLLVVFATFGYIYNHRIKELKRVQRDREEFSRRLIDSQEKERKRIAGELHDSLGQNLLIIKNRALLGLQSSSEPDATDQLGHISDIVSQAIHEVREIAYNLQPYQLERLGLKEAIESVVSKVSEISGIRFFTDFTELNDKFTKDVELNIYRIVQESLNNIVKHSEAQEVHVSSWEESDMIFLKISDNGKGFPVRKSGPVQVNEYNGFGLKSIAERVRIISGIFEMYSDPGKGTTLIIKVPMRYD
jgi:signal transduction histidine kinase/ligand-binding sensor domain-containing protein